MPSNGTPWTESQIDQLKADWAEGYSCSQIGERLGVTRNAVIGKAHRLKLPSRDRSLMNANGMARLIDPMPWSGGPRVPAGTRLPRRNTCRTVFQSREIKPRLRLPKPIEIKSKISFSIITGQWTGGVRQVREPMGEMSKDQLRAMLATAFQNTAAMESQP